MLQVREKSIIKAIGYGDLQEIHPRRELLYIFYIDSVGE